MVLECIVYCEQEAGIIENFRGVSVMLQDDATDIVDVVVKETRADRVASSSRHWLLNHKVTSTELWCEWVVSSGSGPQLLIAGVELGHLPSDVHF